MIPLFDIKPKKSEIKQYLSLYKKNLLKADFIQGQQVKELEKALSNYTGIKYVQTCANGTDALFLALNAIKSKNLKKKYVITTPLTWISTSNAIVNSGYKPFFIDIDNKSFNICYHLIEKALEKFSKKTACVLSVDLFGCPNDNDKIFSICKRFKVPFIIDGAQSFGSRIKSKFSFSYSDIATTSFFPTKPLACFGDGGAIFTNDSKIYQKVKSLTFNGQGNSKNDFRLCGINSRLDTIQASILLEKLKVFKVNLIKKRKIYNLYKSLLNQKYNIQLISQKKSSAYAIFSIVTQSKKKRDEICYLLKKKGIGCNIYYQKLLIEHAHLKKNSLVFKNLNNALIVKDRILSLPFSPNLNAKKIKIITKIINNIEN